MPRLGATSRRSGDNNGRYGVPQLPSVVRNPNTPLGRAHDDGYVATFGRHVATFGRDHRRRLLRLARPAPAGARAAPALRRLRRGLPALAARPARAGRGALYRGRLLRAAAPARRDQRPDHRGPNGHRPLPPLPHHLGLTLAGRTADRPSRRAVALAGQAEGTRAGQAEGASSPSTTRRARSTAPGSPSRSAVFVASSTASSWNAASSASSGAISPASAASRSVAASRPRQSCWCRISASRTGPGRLSNSGRLAAQKQPPGNSGSSA